MKKSLFLIVFISVFSYLATAQDQKPNESSQSISQGMEGLMSQLKAQLIEQLKEQFESQLKTQFDSMSNKRLNFVIDSMLVQLDGLIEKTENFPKDSLAIINDYFQSFNIKINEQELGDEGLFEIDDLNDFYDSFYSQSVQMRKDLKSIRKIKDKNKKAQKLSESMMDFIRESGLWNLLEKMMEKMISFKTELTEEEDM